MQRRLRYIEKFMRHREKELRSHVVEPLNTQTLHLLQDQPPSLMPTTELTRPKLPKGVRDLPPPQFIRNRDISRRLEERKRLSAAHHAAKAELDHVLRLESRDRSLYEGIQKRRAEEGSGDEKEALAVMDSEVWASTRWPVSGGLRHPPVAKSKEEFGESGELALMLASQTIRTPIDDVHTRITNRFVDGVSSDKKSL